MEEGSELVRYRLVVAAAFVTALAVRIASLSLEHLVDDPFMYFDTARTLALTGRLSTSGIQPLYLLLLTPIYAILRPETVAQLDVAARASVGVCIVGDLVAMALLAWLLWRVSGPLAATVGAWIWAVHPGAVAFAVNGLETSWAIAALLALAVAARGRRDALTGALAGVAMLARIDLAGAVAAVGLFVLWDARREPKVALGRTARLAAGWASVYLPWLAFQVWQTGDVLPVSGAATLMKGLESARDFTAYGGPPYFLYLWVLGFLALAFSAPVFALGSAALVRRESLLGLRVLVAQAALVFAYYTCLHGVWWYLGRYLAAWLPLEVATLAAGVAALGRTRVAAIAAVAIVLTVSAVSHRGDDLYAADIEMPDYHAAAIDLIGSLPDGLRFGASESGALSYYFPNRVVNIDGVTNRDAYEAERHRRLSDYVRSEGLDYFVCIGHTQRAWINAKSETKIRYVPAFPSSSLFETYRIVWTEGD